MKLKDLLAENAKLKRQVAYWKGECTKQAKRANQNWEAYDRVCDKHRSPHD